MTMNQKVLTGILLILSGVMIGMITMIYFTGIQGSGPVQVQITEITKSVGFNDSELNRNSITESRPVLRDVALLVTPSVVYIETTVSLRRSPPESSQDESMLDRFIPRRQGTSIGSGVLISQDGYLITNNHVIAGAEKGSIIVGLNDKRTFPAKIIGTDPNTDLAVLKIDGVNLPSVIIGNSDLLQVGDWVVAIGNPFRLRSTVTAGIVSALGRNVDIINEQMRIESFIQTDAAINRGNSGGALINEFGELIGINTAIATENGAYQGYGFAIPINMAFKIARDLIEFGDVQRAYLGVSILAIMQERAKQLEMDFISGVEIINLARNGAAFKAGLRVSDVILSVNGIQVNEANELQAKIALYRPGDEVNLNIWRSGKQMEVNIMLTGMENDEIRSWLNR
jgi:Do/DeqQ family serine protease